MNIHKSKIKLGEFLGRLTTKYLPEHLQPLSYVTTHFMERLLLDRSSELDNVWVSEVFTKVFRDHACEFLFLLESAPIRGRINLQYQGRSIGLVKGYRIEFEKSVFSLTTCFMGVALNPTLEYYVLSLD